MTTMVSVKVSVPHENGFGDSYAKKKGDTYDAPAGAAQSLKANGYVTYSDAKAAKAAFELVGLPTEAEAETPAKANG